jgi:hypothetical protein
LEFKDPALGITRSISAHDPVAARRALKPLASQFTTDAILNTVKQKAGLTLLGAGARAASDVAGIAGNVRAATGNVKDITAEGSKALIGEGDKPGLVQNVTEQTNKIFANTADLSNSAQALGKAYAPKSKLDAKGNAILDAKGNPVMEPTVLDNVSSSVQKGGVAAERIANFLTDPKTYALAAGGIATAALGYVLYKHFTDKPDRAKRSRGPSDGAPRRPRHAPAEHTHAVPGGPVVPLVAQE